MNVEKKKEFITKKAYKLSTKLHKCIKTVPDSGTSSKIKILLLIEYKLILKGGENVF